MNCPLPASYHLPFRISYAKPIGDIFEGDEGDPFVEQLEDKVIKVASIGFCERAQTLAYYMGREHESKIYRD